MGIDRPIVNQPYYHALYRVMEVEVLPACAYYGLGVVSYSPLARGVLTGKYQPGAEAPKERARAAPTGACCRRSFAPKRSPPPKGEGVLREARRRATALRGCLGAQQQADQRRRGRSPHRGAVGRLRKALDCRITKEDEAFINELVTPGHPAAPGYNDPAYPIEGRPTWIKWLYPGRPRESGDPVLGPGFPLARE